MAGPFYVDTAVGNDGNAGTSEGAGNAWATIQKGVDTTQAGEICYVKASGNYNEDIDIDTYDGTAPSPITIEGYTTTVGDGGQVTIDGQNTRSECLSPNSRDHYIWRNFIFTGATTNCVNCSATSYRYIFENCQFTKGSSTPTTSFAGDIRGAVFVSCVFDNFSGDGIALGNVRTARFVSCVFRDNGARGLDTDTYRNCDLHRCVFHDNTDDGVYVGTACPTYISHCTFDGNADNLEFGGNNHSESYVVSSIFSNGTTGIKGTFAGTSRPWFDHNAFYNNTSHRSGSTGIQTGDNDVTLTSDPYTDAAGDDYTLNNTAGGGADCRNAAYNNSDIGAYQHTAAGGSASGVRNPLGGPI